MRYARAIFEHAAKSRSESFVYDSMCRLVETFEREQTLAHVLEAPLVSSADKVSLLLAACGEDPGGGGSAHDAVRLVAANGRTPWMKQIAQAYITLYHKSRGIVTAHLTSASPLDDRAIDKIKVLAAQGKEYTQVQIKTDTDPALLGGFVLDVDGQRLDASVSTQLARLKSNLTE